MEMGGISYDRSWKEPASKRSNTCRIWAETSSQLVGSLAQSSVSSKSASCRSPVEGRCRRPLHCSLLPNRIRIQFRRAFEQPHLSVCFAVRRPSYSPLLVAERSLELSNLHRRGSVFPVRRSAAGDPILIVPCRHRSVRPCLRVIRPNGPAPQGMPVVRPPPPRPHVFDALDDEPTAIHAAHAATLELPRGPMPLPTATKSAIDLPRPCEVSSWKRSLATMGVRVRSSSAVRRFHKRRRQWGVNEHSVTVRLSSMERPSRRATLPLLGTA